MPDAVDWNLAASLGSRVVGGGPRLTPAEASQIVAELYYLAGQATPLVQDTTGLHAYLPSEVKVVDRPEWIRSNLDSFQRISEPLTKRLEGASAFTREIGSRATGVQLGLVLGFVGSRVLGQFEIFTEDDPRLLLVAPNIVTIERQLEAVPRDFRLWVCVHEQTHRIQFAAAPWLTGYLLDNIHEYMRLSDMTTQELLARLFAAVKAVRSDDEPDGIIGALQTAEQKVVFDRLTAVMSLLEGHADVVMDEVGPAAIPTVRSIRAAFQHRRATGSTGWEGLLRRLLGMDLKARQYAQGAEFVRAVMADGGMKRVNAVWESPDHLPTRVEIENPAQWLQRI
ncbi:MAG: zinc-dependent metalloprotease [Candidatus Nanopelagicales bacterium]